MMYNNTATALQFGTNGVVNMTIASGGSVGINTTAPTFGFANVLRVKQITDGTANGIGVEAGSNTNILVFGNDGSRAVIAQSYITTGGYQPIAIETGGSERMRIDTAGNVGLSVTPSAWGSNITALQFPQGVNLYAWNASAVPQLYLSTNTLI